MNVEPHDQVDPPEAPAARSGGRMRDLGMRVVSAALLGGAALGLLYAGVLPFAALILVISLLMCWEWGHIVRQTQGIDSLLIVHGAAVAAAVVLATVGYPAVALIALTAGALVMAVLQFGVAGKLSAMGVLYVGLPSVSLVSLRGGYAPYGLWAVLFVVLAVIATDTLAYFTGRAVGGPKLWPSVSPNKTWSGLIGGVIGAALVGVAFSQFLQDASPTRLAVIGLILGLFAQAGDLAESGLKRSFGVKDASSLIPGHGGFMDRMDGLVVAAVVAVLIGLWGSLYSPARALLLGF